MAPYALCRSLYLPERVVKSLGGPTFVRYARRGESAAGRRGDAYTADRNVCPTITKDEGTVKWQTVGGACDERPGNV